MEVALRTPSNRGMRVMEKNMLVMKHRSAWPRANSTGHKQPIRCRAVDVKDGVLPQQQLTNSEQDVNVPPASNMQAQVMLVPKKNASAALLRQDPAAEDPVGKFMLKCKLAWNLFFPPQEAHATTSTTPKLSPKDLGKQRLQMILVADRCGLSPSSLVEMKKNTLAALADCMDLEELQDAHLRFTMTREGGTTYSMAVPILRPGPYADDGSVVGQAAARNAAVAAAAATAAGWDQEGDRAYDDYMDDDDSAYAEEDQRSLSPVIDVIAVEEGGSDIATVQQISTDSVLFRASSPSSGISVMQAEHEDMLENEFGNDSDEDFGQQLKDLLVDELVNDVEELVQHIAEGDAAAAAAADIDSMDTACDDTAAHSRSSSSPLMDVSASELREVAAKEVERLVDRNHDNEVL